MTETSGRSNFLSKSKWGKLLKTDDAGAGDDKQRFKLNEDVVDFLKPSTERYPGAGTRPATNPRIDTSLAQRWPEAAEVRRAATSGNTPPHPLPAGGTGRGRRRKDVVVRFVNTEPDIIGEGGDEAEAPSWEISRNRTNIARSQSERRSDAGPIIATGTMDGQHFRPGTLARSETSHRGQYSGMQPLPAQAPVTIEQDARQYEKPRPGFFKRTPTGLDSPLMDADAHDNSRSGDSQTADMHAYQDVGGFPRAPSERDLRPIAKIQQRMRAEEGHAFQHVLRSGRGISEDPELATIPHPSDSNDPRAPRPSDRTLPSRAQALPPDSDPRRPLTEHASGSSYIPYKPPHNLPIHPLEAHRRDGQVNVSPPDGKSTEVTGHSSFEDFAARVTHMKGVFRLTADKELSARQATVQEWVRCAVWWFHKGRAGAELIAKHQSNDAKETYDVGLNQPHVDIAKTWWIISDVLGAFTSESGGSNPQSHDSYIVHEIATVKSHLESLLSWMIRRRIMPPHNALIQGQDTTIWIQYPQFTPNLAHLLGISHSAGIENGAEQRQVGALDLLPLGDTRHSFFYNRMFVKVFANTDDVATDRVNLPCILSVVRGHADYQTKLIIASQSSLVSVVVSPKTDKNAPKEFSWQDLSWKSRSHGVYISMPGGFTLNVQFEERDFISLWNLVDYTRKIDATFEAKEDERIVFEVRLLEGQYSDNGKLHAFPREKVPGCFVTLFEKVTVQSEGHGLRTLHRGHRLMLVTPPMSRTLGATSHNFSPTSPFLFDSSVANVGGAIPLVLHIREYDRQCQMVLGFRAAAERSRFLAFVNGLYLADLESMVMKAPTNNFEIETIDKSRNPEEALRSLRWQSVTVINRVLQHRGQSLTKTVLCENMRIVVEHSHGTFTDRLNLDKGELLIRLPRGHDNAIQMLRKVQEDLTTTVFDARVAESEVANALTELSMNVATKATIRTCTFGSSSDLHAFQRAITGYDVLFDSTAATFAITRRRMVVSIHKKLEAKDVRIQVVSNGSQTQVLAFFENFGAADAMIFQVRSTDVFEKVKGDKASKHSVKLVEAKFSLTRKVEHGADDDEGTDSTPTGLDIATRRRFVNLECLDYAEEHDDITIGFTEEDDRERFCEALPAAVTAGRSISLKRRI